MPCGARSAAWALATCAARALAGAGSDTGRASAERIGAGAFGDGGTRADAGACRTPCEARFVAWGFANGSARARAGSGSFTGRAGAQGIGARGFGSAASLAAAGAPSPPGAVCSDARGSADGIARALPNAGRGLACIGAGGIGAWASARAAAKPGADAAESEAAAPAAWSGARGIARAAAFALIGAARAARAARLACRASAMARFHGARAAVSACSRARSSARLMPRAGRGGIRSSGAIGSMRAASSGGSRW